ncbi:MAG TPA: hypothetical protein VIJ94_19535 [Caulobacteraceae bacterium]
MRFGRIPALVLSLGVLLAAPAALASEPAEVVQQLYAEPGLAFGGAGSQGLLASDLRAGLQAAQARSQGSSPIAFDYRYGFKETEISGFELLSQIDNNQAKVVAVFKNFGKPESVDWVLCRTPAGDWRIADASSNTGPEAWDLRQILGLRLDSVRC